MSLHLQAVDPDLAREVVASFHKSFPDFRATVGDVSLYVQHADKTYSWEDSFTFGLTKHTKIDQYTGERVLALGRDVWETDPKPLNLAVMFNSADLPAGDLNCTMARSISPWDHDAKRCGFFLLFDTVLLVFRTCPGGGCSCAGYHLYVLRTCCKQVLAAATYAVIRAVGNYPEIVDMLADASCARMNDRPVQHTHELCYKPANDRVVSTWETRCSLAIPDVVAGFLDGQTVIGACGDDHRWCIVTVHYLVAMNGGVTKVHPLV